MRHIGPRYGTARTAIGYRRPRLLYAPTKYTFPSSTFIVDDPPGAQLRRAFPGSPAFLAAKFSESFKYHFRTTAFASGLSCGGDTTTERFRSVPCRFGSQPSSRYRNWPRYIRPSDVVPRVGEVSRRDTAARCALARTPNISRENVPIIARVESAAFSLGIIEAIDVSTFYRSRRREHGRRDRSRSRRPPGARLSAMYM